MNRKLYFTAIFIFTFCGICAQNPVSVVKANLNGLEFVFDAETGSILSMTYPRTGILLQATPDSAGIVDLAYPVKEFEPLRLASRFSKNAQIIIAKDIVTIHWEELGASRSFCRFQGKISATVTLNKVTHLHIKEWIDCIRNGGTTSANIERAFEEGIACLMAHRSYLEHRRMEWDPVNKKIV